MKTNFSFLRIILIFIFLFSSMVFAQDVMIYRTDIPIVIDGLIDDVWESVEENMVEKVIVNTTDGPLDHSGHWKALWDYDNFYLLAVVTDDSLYDDSEGANEHDDGLDIVFDTDNGDETGPDTADDFILTAEYSTTGDCALSGEKWSYGTMDITGIVAQCIERFDVQGYNIEVSIPLANLGFFGGDLIGFGLRINDDDNGGDRDSQISWYIDTSSDWANPSALAEVMIVDESVGVDEPNDLTSPVHQYHLEQNYPNPFNPSTHIGYSLKNSGLTTLKIYNSMGHLIKTLVNHTQMPGKYVVRWEGTDKNNRQVPSAQYYFQLAQGEHILIQKGLLLR